MVDLFEALSQSDTGRDILGTFDDLARARDGVARITYWSCEDGWTIAYTTSRVQGGPHDGKFITQAFRPKGKGSRSGSGEYWVQVYRRAFSTRKAARARAVALFLKHNPKWAARHPGAK